MLLYSDIKTEVRGRCVDSDDLLTDAWFNRQVLGSQYDLIVRTGGYWLNDSDTFTTEDGEAEYGLASDILVIKRIVDTDNRCVLQRILEEDEAFTDPDRSLTNQPRAYFGTYLKTVQYQPSAASQITIVSSSASDTASFACRIRGKLASGIEIPETRTMNGTTEVTTTNSFVTFSITKDLVSTGYYTVTSNAGVVTNAVLAPEELRRQHHWIRVSFDPGDAYDLRYDFLRNPLRVVGDTDMFEVPDVLEDCLVNVFEERARRYYQEDAKADGVLNRNMMLIKERMNFAKEKRDQSVQWAGDLKRYEGDFMGGLIGPLEA